MERIDIPKGWRSAASLILERGLCKILVLGASDQGKSTFCSYLAWHLLRAGLQPALLDADVGQKDLGPPATITLGYPRLDQALQDLEPAALYFVGAVSPVAHLLPMVVGTRQLLDQANAQAVIINTSGLVTGVGKVLKTYKIDSLRPDVIVALEQNQELNPILAAHRHFFILRLRPSRYACVKSLPVRSERRQAAFCHYFRTASEKVFHLDDLAVQRLPVHPNTNPSAHLTANRLCGLANARQRLLGLGLIRRYDATQRQIRIFTPVNPQGVKVIQLGDLWLNLES